MREGQSDRRRDMLQHFIDAKDQSGQPVKKGDVMIERVNILGVGADTTPIAILAVLGALLLHPEQKNKVTAEIDQAYKDLGLEDRAAEICFKDAEKLPFLSAVIKESMRLHPSITYQLPRVVPDQGVQVGPYHFDRRTICGISPAAMNRPTKVFGEDANEWKPKRWIAHGLEDEKRISAMNQDMTAVSLCFCGPCCNVLPLLFDAYRWHSSEWAAGAVLVATWLLLKYTSTLHSSLGTSMPKF
jgi:cytochrome P450